MVRAGAERLAGVDHDVDRRRRPSGASHGGRTRSRRKRQLTSTGRWNAFQRSRPVVGDLASWRRRRARRRRRRAGRAAPAARRARRRSRTRPRPSPSSRSSRPPGASSSSSASTASASARATRTASRIKRAPAVTAAHSPCTRRSVSRRPWRANAAADLVRALGQHARGDHPLRRALERAGGDRLPAGRRVRFAVTVGAHGAGRRGQVAPVRAHAHAVRGGVARDRLEPVGHHLDRVDRPEAEPRRGDREDAAAGAPVAQRALRRRAPAAARGTAASSGACRRRTARPGRSRPRARRRRPRPAATAAGSARRRPEPATSTGCRYWCQRRSQPGGDVGQRDVDQRVARERARCRRASAARRAARRARTRPRPGRARSPRRRPAGSAAAPRARSPPARAGPGSRAARAGSRVIRPARA